LVTIGVKEGSEVGGDSVNQGFIALCEGVIREELDILRNCESATTTMGRRPTGGGWECIKRREAERARRKIEEMETLIEHYRNVASLAS
jgi:hypothetical protein